MCNTFPTALARIVSLSACGLIAMALAACPVWAQQSSSDKKDTGGEAKDSAKDSKDYGKDTSKDAKDAAKDKDKDAKDRAKDAAKDTKDSAKDTAKERRDSAKDERDTSKDTRDTRKDARDTDRDTRDSARDTRDARDRARDTGRDTRRETRDTARDTRDTRDARDARDTRDTRDARDSRDTRDTARDTRRDTRTERTRERSRASRTQIENFRADSVTSRDLGVTFGRATDRGLVIQDISRNAVLANIGLHRDDVIISVADHRVRSERDFIRWLFAEDLRDEPITIIVLRDDREVPIEVRPVTIIEELVVVEEEFDPVRHFGIVIDDRNDREIVVRRVFRDSPAFVAGIREGDVITTFRGQRLTSPRQFVQVLDRVEPGRVAIEVNRDRRAREFQVDLSRMERRTSARPNLDVPRTGVERREDRRDIRTERRIERQEGVQPATPATPAPPRRPALLPRNK